MSTRSVVAYRTPQGKIRGTYVHYDGYPESMKPALKTLISANGYHSVVRWIEEGIAGNGYSSIDDSYPYCDGDGKPLVCNVTDEQWGYIVYPSGRVRTIDNK